MHHLEWPTTRQNASIIGRRNRPFVRRQRSHPRPILPSPATQESGEGSGVRAVEQPQPTQDNRRDCQGALGIAIERDAPPRVANHPPERQHHRQTQPTIRPTFNHPSRRPYLPSPATQESGKDPGVRALEQPQRRNNRRDRQGALGIAIERDAHLEWPTTRQNKLDI